MKKFHAFYATQQEFARNHPGLGRLTFQFVSDPLIHKSLLPESQANEGTHSSERYENGERNRERSASAKHQAPWEDSKADNNGKV